VICSDSGLADALSTALFLMNREEGEALALSCGAEAFWVDAAGQEFMTDGFEKMLRT
jgi:thiamine biosynthesis lipoprotein